MCPLPRQHWAFGFAPRVIISLRVPNSHATDQSSRLSDALQLTAAEGKIVELLALGHSRAEIATRRGVSVQTVASQLRTIFQKTGVNREAELVSIGRAVIEMGAC